MTGYNLYVYPLCSVYGMCIYIWLKFMIDVGGYSIYRVSGYSMCWSYIPLHKCIQACFQVANRIELFINHLHPFTIPKWHKGLYSPSFREIVFEAMKSRYLWTKSVISKPIKADVFCTHPQKCNTSEYTTLAASHPCGTTTALDIGPIVSSASHGRIWVAKTHGNLRALTQCQPPKK